MFEGRDQERQFSSLQFSRTVTEPLLTLQVHLIKGIGIATQRGASEFRESTDIELANVCEVKPVAVWRGGSNPEEIQCETGHSATVQSAILLPFVVCNGEAYLLVTKRSSDLRTAPGAVVFPGGRIEEGETPIEAALRETFEEVGLKVLQSSVLGVLPSFVRQLTKAYTITPVVAFQEVEELRFPYSKSEVEEVISIPVSQWLQLAEVHGPFFPVTTSSGNLAPGNAYALEVLRRSLVIADTQEGA